MSIFQKIIELFMGHKDGLKLPEQLGAIDDLKTQAQDILEQHGGIIDQVTDKIPGTADDELVDQAKNILK